MESEQIVSKQIGKKVLKMRESHMLPVYMEQFPFYDRALPLICEEVSKMDGHLNVVDVGANIGDSVALITDRVQGSFLCIEGDSDFLPLLKENIKDIRRSKIELEESYCSHEDKIEDNISIERNNGTAKIVQSNNQQESSLNLKKLDSIIKEHKNFAKANVLKIDTDGFELNVLKGGENFLKNAKPVVYFEFTPELYVQKQQDPFEIFKILTKCGYKKALFYDNFGNPYEIVNLNKKDQIRKLISLIDNNKIYYFDILTVNSSNQKHAKLFESMLLNHAQLSAEVIAKSKVIASTVQSEPSNLSEDDQSKLLRYTNDLNNIYGSRSWKLIHAAKQIILLKLLWKIALKVINIPRESIHNIKEKSWLFLIIIKKLITPRKKRVINHKSKKIVVIDHSYHKKTKSSKVLIDYLREFYEVKVVYDESWTGANPPDLSFVDDKYLAVVFWQSPPTEQMLKAIKNENIIFCPMYDSHGMLGYDFWKTFENIKIINFTYALHKKLSKWGLESHFIRYFPTPEKFSPGEHNTVFFWQRMLEINIHTVETLLGKNPAKIHIHKAVDPNHPFIKPSKESEKRYSISYSDWFKTSKESLDLINKKSIYIAPRIYEGIGLGFLEAMAKGKAVIANDSPTMNEYIKNKHTGYLFKYEDPKEIDLSNIAIVQKNAHEYMQKGYREWEKKKRSIIQFILKP